MGEIWPSRPMPDNSGNGPVMGCPGRDPSQSLCALARDGRPLSSSIPVTTRCSLSWQWPMLNAFGDLAEPSFYPRSPGRFPSAAPTPGFEEVSLQFRQSKTRRASGFRGTSGKRMSTHNTNTALGFAQSQLTGSASTEFCSGVAIGPSAICQISSFLVSCAEFMSFRYFRLQRHPLPDCGASGRGR